MVRVCQFARLAALTLALFGNSCVLGPSENSAPRSYFVSPNVSRPEPHEKNPRMGTAVLLISLTKAQTGFDTPRMAYLLRPYEINYYGFNQWADTPARMLHRTLVENLDKSGDWSAVLSVPSSLPAQFRLDTDNLVLEQQFFSSPSRIRIALRAQIVDLKKPAIIVTRHFEVFEIAPSDDPYGGVQAANRAAEKLIVEMAEWLNTTLGTN